MASLIFKKLKKLRIIFNNLFIILLSKRLFNLVEVHNGINP
jgi:hypothetical protein